MDPVVVLFVRSDSIYKTLPGVECYDSERDARTWPGGCPVVCHPPCKTWGCLANKAHWSDEEHALGVLAVSLVRKWGGVIEHPERSKLWKECGLPGIGQRDAHGGWTKRVDQHWWGHRARKRTLLYICGCDPGATPAEPLTLTEPTHVVSSGYAKGPHRHRSRKPECAKWEREATPPAFAAWLVALARKCSEHNNGAELRRGAP